MRSTILAVAAAAALTPSLASAQVANRAISLESGVFAPLQQGAPAAAAFAISAARWLDGFEDGDLEGVLRVAFASAGETGGRAAAGGLSATAGLRLSLGRAPLRPQLFADLGWARVGGAKASSRVAFGLGAALEWFPAPELSIAARLALRGRGASLGGEGVLAVSAYF